MLADIHGPGPHHPHLDDPGATTTASACCGSPGTTPRSPACCCPLGDFFGLGHGIVNSYQSLLFIGLHRRRNNQFNQGCALNCYAPMPFRERAVVELVNESGEEHGQYFYVDYETLRRPRREDARLLPRRVPAREPLRRLGPRDPRQHARRPTSSTTERTAWDNNYVILDTKGRGHYIGCNL